VDAIRTEWVQGLKMKKTNDNGASGIKEIAKKANVAIATVDRVIHNRPGVSAKTREKINAIIKKLNYQPNIVARRLASRKILHFAILMPRAADKSNYWGSQLKGMEVAESEIKQYGIHIDKYFFDPSSKQSFIKKGKELLAKQPDAVLVLPVFSTEAFKFTMSCQEQHIPYAFINSEITGAGNLFYIGPHLFQSGYQAAHLFNSGNRKNRILIVNIIGETDNEEHLLKKEEGFRTYFLDNKIANPIIRVEIHSTEQAIISKKLKAVFETHPDLDGIFVTGEKVHLVAAFLLKQGTKDIMLIGYDFLNENIEYLKKDIIDFLICQKLQEQGYRAVIALYQKLVFNADVEKVYYMPVDIVTRENYIYYNN
jgi:LacI family transcriptional regulator